MTVHQSHDCHDCPSPQAWGVQGFATIAPIVSLQRRSILTIKNGHNLCKASKFVNQFGDKFIPFRTEPPNFTKNSCILITFELFSTKFFPYIATPFGIALLAYKLAPEGPKGPLVPLAPWPLAPPWARPTLLGIGRARSEKIRNVFIRSNLIRVGGCRGA